MSEKRAAIYCRVSSPKQAKEERHSLSDQEVVCSSVAEKHDLKVFFVEDMVVSASKLSASRPGDANYSPGRWQDRPLSLSYWDSSEFNQAALCRCVPFSHSTGK